MIQATFVQKVIIKHPTDNKFLVLVRSLDDKSRPGDFDIPGGSLKNGELHEDSLLREVFEETKLDIVDISPILVKSGYDETKNKYFIYIEYKARAKNTKVTISPLEHSGFDWLTVEEFKAKAPDHILLEHIDKAFNYLPKN